MPLPVEFLLIDALRHLDAFSVPGIGSFTRAFVSAQVQTAQQAIDPPTETIVFSEEITPAGLKLFGQFLGRPGNPASEVPNAADEVGREINQVLASNGKYVMGDLGVLLNGSTGLDAQWVADVSHKIYSDLFGFKSVKLPAAKPGVSQPASSRISAPVVSAPVPTPAPVSVQTPQEKIQEDHSSETTTSSLPPKQVVIPVEEITPEKQAEVVSRPEPKAKPAPVVTESKVGEAVIPPPKAQASRPLPKNKRKARFPWVLTIVVLLLVLVSALWFLMPHETVPVTPEVAAPAPVAQPEPEPEVIPEPAPVVAPGYYLIVASSKSETEVQNEAKYWSDQGLVTEILPPDASSVFYRLSVLHTQTRSEAVNKMIELKDETYSWILTKP